MASVRTLVWIERLAWIGIYAGLFAIVLGIVSGGVHVIAGWSLGVVGSVAVAAGIVLIVVRSRFPDPAPDGAQSPPKESRKP